MFLPLFDKVTAVDYFGRSISERDIGTLYNILEDFFYKRRDLYDVT